MDGNVVAVYSSTSRCDCCLPRNYRPVCWLYTAGLYVGRYYCGDGDSRKGGSKAEVTITIRRPFDCNSTALRLFGDLGDPPCVTSPVSLRVALPPWRARSSRGCGALCRTKWLCKHQAPADVIGCQPATWTGRNVGRK